METNTKQSQPAALYMLSGIEMWERFCFYGARTILVLFMISPILGFTDKTAMHIFGIFMAVVYLTPVLGGFIADHFLTKKSSIILGAALMIIGQFTIAAYDIIPAKIAFTAGVSILILGIGFIKPNITSLVGDLYGDNDARRDAGFTIFYMAINIGAALSPLVCSYLGEKIAFKYGFMAAGAGMAAGLVWFLAIQKTHLAHIGNRHIEKHDAQNPKQKAPLTQQEKDRIKAILIFAFFAIFFWAFYEQSGSSLTLFAQRATDTVLFGWNMPIGYLQSLPPAFVIILAPVFAKMWVKMGEKDPSTPVKFAWGLGLLGASFLIIVLGAYIYQKTGVKISVLWLASLYLVSVLGELCMSPVGLSMITKLAPVKYAAMFMGVWFTGNFFGGLLGGVYAGYYNDEHLAAFFSVPAVLSIACAFVIFALRNKIQKWMHGIK
ncbi:proton-dependent oligopeptide transporter [Parelusimicrobium proximum]|uniref:peptide MFS transporter n=1 Tax=Parelusimicrobium proximum TaxID=3228953 RepID=UPI003D1742DB